MEYDSAIRRVLERATISQLAPQLGLTLGSKAADYRLAICPFHDDTQPSLALYDERGNPHFYARGQQVRKFPMDR
jgi:hypothetical protein